MLFYALGLFDLRRGLHGLLFQVLLLFHLLLLLDLNLLLDQFPVQANQLCQFILIPLGKPLLVFSILLLEKLDVELILLLFGKFFLLGRCAWALA